MRHPRIVTIVALAWLATGCAKAPEATPAPAQVSEAKSDQGAAKAKAEAPPKAQTNQATKPAPKAAAKTPAAKPAPKVAAKTAAAKPAPKAAPTRPASKLVAWDAPLEWHDWDAGLAKAKAENKPIMLLVFADW